MLSDRFPAAALFAVLAVGGSALASDSAADLMRDIRLRGAKAVASDLARDERRLEAVTAQIEAGSSDWLHVAAELRSGSDGAVTESLNYAVARSIPRLPTQVLKLIGKPFAIDDVCTSPFIEPEGDVAEEYEKAATAALKSVTDPALRRVRDRCLKLLAPSPKRRP